MLLQITNISNEPDHLPGIYTQLQPGETVSVRRTAPGIEGEPLLAQRVLDGILSIVLVQEATDTVFTFSFGALSTVANVAPTVNDDITKGYYPGSRWLNIATQQEFLLFDNTEGAAVWTVGVVVDTVVGPPSALDLEVAVFDGTTGKVIQGGGHRIYPPAATDPATPSPGAGDSYFNTLIGHRMQFDAVRNKWLSVSNSGPFQLGRAGNTAPSVFYNHIGGLVMSATLGFTMPFAGTVVAFGYTRSDIDAATFEITAGGVTIASIASAATSGFDNALNSDFAQGDVLALRNSAGGNTTSDVTAWFDVKWRV